MKAHRTDLVSFAFGLVFLALSGLVAARPDCSGSPCRAVGWFLAGALILIGVLGLVGALRSGRRRSPSDRRGRCHGRRQPGPGASAPRCPATDLRRGTAGLGGRTVHLGRSPRATTTEVAPEAPPTDVIHPAWLAHRRRSATVPVPTDGRRPDRRPSRTVADPADRSRGHRTSRPTPSATSRSRPSATSRATSGGRRGRPDLGRDRRRPAAPPRRCGWRGRTHMLAGGDLASAGRPVPPWRSRRDSRLYPRQEPPDMTQSPAVRTTGRSGPVRIGERAARTLVAELARHNDPKAALLVGADPGVRGARRGDRRAAAR